MARVAALVPAFAFRTPPPAFVLRAALLGDDADARSVARLKSVLRGTPPQVIAERLRLVAGVNVSSALAGCTTPVLHIEEARERLERMLGKISDWSALTGLLPFEWSGGERRRSAVASTLLACLEMARDGKVQLQQASPFAEIYVRDGTPGLPSEASAPGA